MRPSDRHDMALGPSKDVTVNYESLDEAFKDLLTIVYGLAVTTIIGSTLDPLVHTQTPKLAQTGVMNTTLGNHILLGVSFTLVTLRFFHGNSLDLASHASQQRVVAALTLIAIAAQGVILSAIGTLLLADQSSLWYAAFGLFLADIILDAVGSAVEELPRRRRVWSLLAALSLTILFLQRVFSLPFEQTIIYMLLATTIVDYLSNLDFYFPTG